MDRGLWITWYDLPAQGRDAYLAWLHGIYIPKLIKRPGFLWAAHYVAEKSFVPTGGKDHLRRTNDPAVPTGHDYILLFGAEGTHAFARPVPRKLHAELPEEDRKMLAMRIGERVNIVTEEARLDGPEAKRRESQYTLSPCIQFGSFNMRPGADEDELLDWYTNWRIPTMGRLPGCVGFRKFVSVSGWAKHVALYEFVSIEARNDHFLYHEHAHPTERAWSEKVLHNLMHAPGSSTLARRIWPPIK